MSMSVCVSVCPWGYLQNHIHDLYQFFSWILPMVMARSFSGRVTKSQGEGAILEVFFPIVQHSIWDPFKYGWTDRDAVWDDECAWPEEQCVTWRWWSPKGKGQFWGKTFLTCLTLLWIVNLIGPCSGVHTTGADVWLQALDESYRSQRGLGLQTAGEVWYLWLPC